jgi:hypothetical protein
MSPSKVRGTASRHKGCYFYCRTQPAHQPLGLRHSYKSLWGASHIFASCLDVVYAAVLRYVLSAARTNKKVLHSSHFLALRRHPTKSVTPWPPTSYHSSTKAIKLKPRLLSSLAIMPRITLKHLSDKTSSSGASTPSAIGWWWTPLS